jgi:hypothetical protein
MNPGKGMDRPTMHKLWVGCLEKYYLEWEPTTKIPQFKKDKMLKAQSSR